MTKFAIPQYSDWRVCIHAIGRITAAGLVREFPVPSQVPIRWVQLTRRSNPLQWARFARRSPITDSAQKDHFMDQENQLNQRWSIN